MHVDSDCLVAGAARQLPRRVRWPATRSFVASATPTRLSTRGGKDHNLRWAILSVIEETARHAGHADIIREQIDGQTGR